MYLPQMTGGGAGEGVLLGVCSLAELHCRRKSPYLGGLPPTPPYCADPIGKELGPDQVSIPPSPAHVPPQAGLGRLPQLYGSQGQGCPAGLEKTRWGRGLPPQPAGHVSRDYNTFWDTGGLKTNLRQEGIWDRNWIDHFSLSCQSSLILYLSRSILN